MSTEDEEEVVANGETQIRRSGNVNVVTIPSALANLNAVKRQYGQKRPMLVVRRAGKYLIEILIEEEPPSA